MIASSPVDGFELPWADFAEFFQSRDDIDSRYLTEADHEVGSRHEWTVGQWCRRVEEVAAALEALGVKQADSVAVLAGNSSDALALAYACWVSGVCYLPLNPHEPLERQAYIVRDARATLLVHTRYWRERAEDIGRGAEVPSIDTAALAQSAEAGRSASGIGTPSARGSLDVPALRVYTSGTTGQPKGVVLTARNLLTDCDALMRGLKWEAGTRLLTVLPIHHVNGLVISSLLPWYAGYSTVLCDRFRSERFWEDVAGEKANACSVVPSLLEFLLAGQRRPAPGCFREMLCGAGPLMPDAVSEFEAAFRIPVRHLYGLSETTAVATLMPPLPEAERNSWYQDHGFPSIGRALPHVEVDIHNTDGAPCAAGERGEIVVRGATVTNGYAGRPEDSTRALRDGWFHSGDEGFKLDGPEGVPYFFITGRIKEIIIRGGANISPFLIDEVLRSHPAVRFGLAVPFDNRYYGEEVAAYVVAHAPVTEREILDFCAERLDHAACPKVVLFGDDVPFTSTGKAKRLALKETLVADLARYRNVQFRRRRNGASARMRTRSQHA